MVPDAQETAYSFAHVASSETAQSKVFENELETTLCQCVFLMLGCFRTQEVEEMATAGSS